MQSVNVVSPCKFVVACAKLRISFLKTFNVDKNLYSDVKILHYQFQIRYLDTWI